MLNILQNCHAIWDLRFSGFRRHTVLEMVITDISDELGAWIFWVEGGGIKFLRYVGGHN
jgi:hypothetical protein